MEKQEVTRCIERFLLLTSGSSTKLVGEQEELDLEEKLGEFTEFEYPEDFPPADPYPLDPD